MLTVFANEFFICSFVLSCVCRDSERNKETAFLEAQIYEYVEILGVSSLPAVVLFSLLSFHIYTIIFAKYLH